MIIVLLLLFALFAYLMSKALNQKKSPVKSDIKRGAIWQFSRGFFKENMGKFVCCQLIFALLYGISIYLFFFVPYLAAILLLAIGIQNYISITQISFHLLDHGSFQGARLFASKKIQLKLFALFFGAVEVAVMISSLFVMIMSYSFDSGLMKGFVIFPILAFIWVFLIQKILCSYFTVPYFLLEQYSFSEAILLSQKISSRESSQIRRLFVEYIAVFFIGLILCFALFAGLGAFPENEILMVLGSIGMLVFLFLPIQYLGFVFVSVALLYRVLSSDYIQNPENSTLNEQCLNFKDRGIKQGKLFERE